jgi:adenosylmethionine-8-amino-7-oxononanoate aminotransferase
VQKTAPCFENRQRELVDIPVVSEIRVIGMMAGAECSVDPDHPNQDWDLTFLLDVDQICQQNGLLLHPVYATAVVSLPLTITKTQIDDLTGILPQGLETAPAR